MAGKIKHEKQHAVDDPNYHTGTATEDDLLSADSNGLPKDSGLAASNVKKGNFAATAAPLETDDSSNGYSAGSVWWWPDGRKAFLCFSASVGSAVWKLIFSDALVSNKTGAPLTQLFAVRPDTPQGNFPTVQYAKADAETPSQSTIGVMLETVADNGKGYVIESGNIYQVNATGSQFGEVWAAGDTLYLSAATAGYLTKTEPVTPNHLVIIGRVIVAHATEGVIDINVSNGWETYELHDVSNTPPDTDGMVKEWDVSNGYYTPTTTPRLIGTEFTGIPTTAVDIQELTTDPLPTLDNNQRTFNTVFAAAGVVTDSAAITDGGGATVNLAARDIFIRSTDSDTGVLYLSTVGASNGNSIPAGVARYIGIEYNAGSPQWVIKTTDAWTDNIDFPMGTVVNESGTLHILNNPVLISNSLARLVHRLSETSPYEWAEKAGGGKVSNTGTRNLAITATEFYDRLNEFTFTAKDTSVSDTFDIYSSAGLEASAATQWPNTQYDNGGTLTDMTVNWYAWLWLYAEMDDQFVMVYGTAQYVSPAAALNDPAPTTLPLRIQSHGRPLAKILFQKAASTPTDIISLLGESLTASGTVDHGDTSGLSDDDHTQYSLISSQAGVPSSTPSRVGETNVDTTNDNVYHSTGTASSSDWTLSTPKRGQATITFDGGGSVLTTGAKKVYIEAPYTGTITANRLFADQSGSIVIDIWKDTYANFPPTVADTITASAKPTLSSAQKSEDTTLTGWTTSVTKGDILEFNIDSVTTITKCVLTLHITKTAG
jgi:hypothetical protein